MDGKLRNMTSLYLRQGNNLLLLYRIGSKVITDSYTASAGGHFEKEELNDAKACILRELYEETGIVDRKRYRCAICRDCNRIWCSVYGNGRVLKDEQY